MYRPARFVRNVRVVTFKDVNVEELDKPDLELPGQPAHHLIGGSAAFSRRTSSTVRQRVQARVRPRTSAVSQSVS